MAEQKMQEKSFPLLQVESLCCKSRRQMLLDQVSFSLNSGESLGILGLQQSGKSLLLHVLAGAVRASSGKILLNGYTPRQGKNFYQNLGLVTEKPSLFADLQVHENLDLIRNLKNVKKNTDIDALLVRLDLTGHWKERVGSLPPGLYQRLALACALLNQPSLLLMDDVLYGIDAASFSLLQNELQRFTESGGTLLQVVHAPQDLAAVQQAAWMENGRLELLPKAEVAARWPVLHGEAGE